MNARRRLMPRSLNQLGHGRRPHEALKVRLGDGQKKGLHDSSGILFPLAWTAAISARTPPSACLLACCPST